MSRVRRYSRSGPTAQHPRSPTGLSPSAVTRSSGLRLHDWVPRRDCRPLHEPRTTPIWHRRQAVPPHRFGLLPVRSPLLRESSLFLGVLRCFSSPGALQDHSWCLAVRQTGCPIRTSPARRLPAPPRSISPRGRVLPRLPPPRHPPCALHRQSSSTTSGFTPHARGNRVSARHGDEVTLSPQHSLFPSPHTVRRGPSGSCRSRCSRLLLTLDEIARQNNYTKHIYLQCARTPEQARSFRDAPGYTSWGVANPLLFENEEQRRLRGREHPTGLAWRIVKVRLA